jgi:hypothetical protein
MLKDFLSVGGQSRGRKFGGYENAWQISVMRASNISPRQRQVKSGDINMWCRQMPFAVFDLFALEREYCQTDSNERNPQSHV